MLRQKSLDICKTAFSHYIKYGPKYRKQLKILSCVQTRNITSSQHGYIKVSEEVKDALHHGKGVVALESSIITNGMPHPHNLSTALEVEDVIRQNGSIPATVAVLNGQIRVGLTKEELEYLADPSTATIKTSRRDLSTVLSAGLNGGTTVSGTMLVAHLSGIPIFVTGGIGGVHRNGENSMDISSDLTELGRTPVTVISAGIKSILDIGRTLEYLETEGVCVATFGPDKDFPAFFVPKSGFFSPYNVATAVDAATLIDTHLSMALQSGILIGVPIPEEQSANGGKIEECIQSALTECLEKNITGKETTPYILQRVNELSQGASLQANIALIKNNAAIGSQIAVELSNLRSQKSSRKNAMTSPNIRIKQSESSSDSSGEESGYTDEESSSDTERVVVVGGSIVDFYARVKVADFQSNGATYPGSIQQSFGGVGRNIADGLSRLGMNPLFISAVGKDSHQTAYQAYCKHMDLSGVQTLANHSTASYCAILKEHGDLMFGIGDMDIHSQISPEYISQFDEDLSNAPLVCIDGNITPDTMAYVIEVCKNSQVPVWFDPTDIHKAMKPFDPSVKGGLTYSSPNLNELRNMYLGLTGTLHLRIGHAQADELSLEAVLDETIWLSKVVVQEIPVVLVTLGRHGVVVCRKDSGDFPVRGQRIEMSNQMTVDHFPAVTDEWNPSQIVSVSGAGDCLSAAMITAIVKGYDPHVCVKAGLLAAQLSLQSHHTVPATVTPNLMNVTEINKLLPWQPTTINQSHLSH